MSIGLGVTKTYTASTQNINQSTTDLLKIAVVKPANVVRFGFIVDSSTASGTTVVVSLDKRVTAGSDSGRVELATLSPTATVAQGKGVYFDLTARQEVNPGEELIFEAKTAAGVAATAHVFVEVVEYPFVQTSADATEDRLANMTEET